MNIAGKLTGYWMDVGKEGKGMGGLQLFPTRKHFQASTARVVTKLLVFNASSRDWTIVKTLFCLR